ncbi:MAG TPA: extensin family protein, partial [Pseudolabrys sp.]|nr:extensin family protein [Pseudolabrys sp.]
DPATVTSAPTPCDTRLNPIADIELMPRLIGPGACGGHDLVRMTAIRLPDRKRVAVQPAALLACPMAESLAAWLRDAVAPALADHGDRLTGIENYDSYQCRTRDNLPGAKISEHAHGDAIDVRAFLLAGGYRLSPVDKTVDTSLRIALRDSACHRFTTVLGPGEAYHAGHIHLDDIARNTGYRICHWDVLAPGSPALPPPRPALVANAASLPPPPSPAPEKSTPRTRAAPASGRIESTGPQTGASPNEAQQAARDDEEAAAKAVTSKPALSKTARGKAAVPASSESADAEVAVLPAGAVPLPAPRPASLAAADARRPAHVRHRRHRRRWPAFHFPFILWR